MPHIYSQGFILVRCCFFLFFIVLVLLSSLWLNWFLWGHSEGKKNSVILVLRRGEERFLCLIVEKRLNDLFL